MTAKSVLKSLARPVTRRLYWRIDQRAAEQWRRTIGPSAEATAATVQELRQEMDRSVGAILGAVSTQNATSRLRAREDDARRRDIADLQVNLDGVVGRMGQLEQRLELVRREILLEARYDHRRPEPPAVETRLLRPANLSASGELRINLGAGHIPKEGYLNVDSRPLEGIDVVCDVRHLPFEKDSVAEIYSAHFLEHFPVEELRRSLLPYLVSLLADGGLFVAVVPDMRTMVERCATGEISWDDFLEVTYGGQEYEGDFHFSGFTPELLRHLLEEAGLSDFTVREAARQNGLCFEFEVEAVRRLSDAGT